MRALVTIVLRAHSPCSVSAWCLLCLVSLAWSDSGQDVCVQSRLQDREHPGQENIAALGRRLSGEKNAKKELKDQL